jgi:hypothetical protein
MLSPNYISLVMSSSAIFFKFEFDQLAPLQSLHPHVQSKPCFLQLHF